MNNRFSRSTLLALAGTLLLAGCSSDNSSFETPNTNVVKNEGVVSHKNFSILADDFQPKVIDPTTGVFSKTDVAMTVYIGDRYNQTLTNKQTVYFKTEYGTIQRSCITDGGSCSVTWSAIKPPITGGPGSDMQVEIVAYTIGEESFTDTNGNGVFDDGDVFASSDDLEEPFVDVNNNGVYDAGEEIIDVVNGNDLTGQNGVHDTADGFFNGPGCAHSSLCSTTVTTNNTIWDSITLKIDGPPTTP